MRAISQTQLAESVAGTWAPGAAFGPGSQDIVDVTHNSRAVAPGSLFVALRGERLDGHAYVAQALAAGATLAMVDAAGARDHNLANAHLPHLIVADTQRALGDLAQHVRQELGRPVAAITGSNGKTTTKELLAAALGHLGPVHRTAGNLNNLIGLPQTVFAWPETAWAAVLEMGMNAPGEIARLTQIAVPEVGIITCVAAAHLQGLGSLAGVAKAKVELLAGLPAGAPIVLNGDDEPLMAAALPHLPGRPLHTFGRSAKATVRLVQASHIARADAGGAPGLHITLAIAGQHHEGHLPLVGLHNGMNAAAAVAAAAILGVDPDSALRAMAHVLVPGARGRVLPGPRPDIKLLDDSYNANPHSMAAALATLADLAGEGRRLAVLGDMLELGQDAQAQHQALGQAAARAGVSHIVAVGEFANVVAAAARSAGCNAVAVPDAAAALEHVRNLLHPGDWCLIKGSRGVRLEIVVQGIRAAALDGPSDSH